MSKTVTLHRPTFNLISFLYLFSSFCEAHWLSVSLPEIALCDIFLYLFFFLFEKVQVYIKVKILV